MFERDRVTHFARHRALEDIGIVVLSVDDLDDAFQEGAPDTYPMPGVQPPTYGRVARLPKGRRAALAAAAEEPVIEVLDDEPLISLADIVES